MYFGVDGYDFDDPRFGDYEPAVLGDIHPELGESYEDARERWVIEHDMRPWDQVTSAEYDGHEMWLVFRPNELKPGPGSCVGSAGQSIVFLQLGEGVPTPGFSGRRYYVRLAAQRDDDRQCKRDTPGRVMYDAIPQVNYVEPGEKWFFVGDGMFVRKATLTDWCGEVTVDDKELERRPALIEKPVGGKERSLASVDLETGTAILCDSVKYAGTEIVRDDDGVLVLREISRIKPIAEIEVAITGLRYVKGWPYSDAFPQNGARAVNLLDERVTVTAEHEGKTYTVQTSARWSELSDRTQELLYAAHPLCACGAVRQPCISHECTNEGNAPASVTSLEALAAKFKGGR